MSNLVETCVSLSNLVETCLNLSNVFETFLILIQFSGVEPKVIEAQKAELKNIKKGIDSTKPIVDKCKATGKELMSKVGEPERPELKRHIDDLDNAWDNITSMFHKREKNLIVAMEKAMEYHDTLQGMYLI